MKTILMVSAALLIGGCNMQPATLADAGQKPDAPASATRRPSIRPGSGRFYARDRSGGSQELSLKRFAVRASTHPGTVRSHVTIEVATQAAGQSEAVLRLAVPPGAAVTSAVLWIDGRPMNGAFVERQRATAVYDSIVARRRDPALVTWDGPGWIAASIFPLEQNQPRRFELEWIEPAAIVNGQVQYRVPTISEGDRLIGRAELEVDGRKRSTGDGSTLSIGRAAAAPVVAGRAPGDPFQQLLVQAPPVQTAPHLVLIAETSASMAPGDRVRQRAAIETLLRGLPPGAKVTLLAADWDATAIAEDAEAAAWPDALAKIDRVVSAGALHLERALLAGVARARARGADAVLFVGAGQDGFGGDALRAPLAALRDANLRLSVLVVGGDVPPGLAEAAARTGGEAIAARALADTTPLLVDALRPRPIPPKLEARGAGEWFTLKTIAGQTVWIGRALEAPPGGAVAEAGEAQVQDLTPLWHRARMEWPSRDAGAPAIAPDTLTPATALLVLENEQEYARFGLATPEPVDAPAEKSAAPPMGRDSALGHAAEDTLGGLVGNQIAEAYGVSGLGLVGTGSGGGGTAEGTIGLGNLGTIGKGGGNGNGSGYGRGAGGLGGRRARAPDVVPGTANVRGTLDKEIIRRIIRRHVNEVKFCYDQQLMRRPDLGGRVLVQFTIGASGEVIASVLQSSTVGNSPVENCIVQAVRRWEFPRPLGGGIVIVSYPFELTPGDQGAAAAASARAPITEAQAILAGRGDVADRVARVAARLGLRAISDPEVLAWTVERRGRSFETGLLVARLLRLAKRDHDAVRVLSESGGAAPGPIAAELRVMGAATDAAEVSRLARR